MLWKEILYAMIALAFTWLGGVHFGIGKGLERVCPEQGRVQVLRFDVTCLDREGDKTRYDSVELGFRVPIACEEEVWFAKWQPVTIGS